MADTDIKRTQDQAVLARDSALIAMDALLDVVQEVGQFCVDVTEQLLVIRTALRRGSSVSDDPQDAGTTGPPENAGE